MFSGHINSSYLCHAMNKGFSVELIEKRFLKQVSISNDSRDRVLIEGDLGQVKSVALVEDSVLEIFATHGNLRVDVDVEILLGSFSKLHGRHAKLEDGIDE